MQKDGIDFVLRDSHADLLGEILRRMPNIVTETRSSVIHAEMMKEFASRLGISLIKEV